MALIPNPRPDMYGGVRRRTTGWVTGFTRRGHAASAASTSSACRSLEAQRVRGARGRRAGRVGERALSAAHRRAAPGASRRSSRRAVPATSAPRRDYLADLARRSPAREGDRLVSGAQDRHRIRRRSLTRTAVWDDVTVGAKRVLDECIVADGVRAMPESALPSAVRSCRATETPPGRRVERPATDDLPASGRF